MYSLQITIKDGGSPVLWSFKKLNVDGLLGIRTRVHRMVGTS